MPKRRPRRRGGRYAHRYGLSGREAHPARCWRAPGALAGLMIPGRPVRAQGSRTVPAPAGTGSSGPAAARSRSSVRAAARSRSSVRAPPRSRSSVRAPPRSRSSVPAPPRSRSSVPAAAPQPTLERTPVRGFPPLAPGQEQPHHGDEDDEDPVPPASIEPGPRRRGAAYRRVSGFPPPFLPRGVAGRGGGADRRGRRVRQLQVPVRGARERSGALDAAAADERSRVTRLQPGPRQVAAHRDPGPGPGAADAPGAFPASVPAQRQLVHTDGGRREQELLPGGVRLEPADGAAGGPLHPGAAGQLHLG